MKSVTFGRLIDFLFFMESESIAANALKFPESTLFLQHLMRGNKVDLKWSAIGPFCITNIFFKDHLKPVAASDVSVVSIYRRELAALHPDFANVPLYQLLTIYHWFNKIGHDAPSFEELYDRYYGPYDGKALTAVQKRRVDSYVDKYVNKDTYFSRSIA
jgi:hypothetical protein